MTREIILMKLVVVMGIVSLIGSMMTGDAWAFQELSDAMESEPILPEFEDPFALKAYIAHSGVPVATTVSPPDEEMLVGCELATYYECINTPDGIESYIILEDPSFGVFIPELPSLPPDVRLARIEVEIQAQTFEPNATALVIILTPFTNVLRFHIPQSEPGSTQFTTLTSIQIPEEPAAWNSVSNRIDLLSLPSESVRLSFVRVSLYAAGDPECTAPEGAWFPQLDEFACAIAQAIDWAITSVQFAVNAVIFAFTWLAAWVTWFGAATGAFLTGLATLMTWFLGLDAPPPVLAFFALVTFAPAFLFFVMIISWIRGGM